MDFLVPPYPRLTQGFTRPDMAECSHGGELVACCSIWGLSRKSSRYCYSDRLRDYTGKSASAGLSASSDGGVINILYRSGILTELFPCLLFIGLGAMIDFGPMLANPVVLILALLDNLVSS